MAKSKKSSAIIQLELDSELALSLYDFLTREIEDRNGAGLMSLTNHEGELWSLDELHGLLERELVVQFDKDYSAFVSRANETMVRRRGQWPT